MAEANEEFPSVNADFENMEEGDPAVAIIQPLNEVVPNIYLESENPSVNNAVSDRALLLDFMDGTITALKGLIKTAKTIPALAAVLFRNIANSDNRLTEDLQSFPAGDACDASDSVPEDLAVGLELPQTVVNPNIKSLVDVSESDMMGVLGLVRKEHGEMIEKAKEEMMEVSEILTEVG